MKKKLLLLIILITGHKLIYSQTHNIFQIDNADYFKYYFLNPDKGDRFKTDKVIVKSVSEFDCEKKIYEAELYNLHLPDRKLILFSVLPSPVDGKSHWKKIDANNIKQENRLTPTQLNELAITNCNNYKHSGYKLTDLVKLRNIKVIIKKIDGYYVNETDCLTEFFEQGTIVPNNGFNNQNPLAEIDTSNVPLSTAEFEIGYYRRNGHYSFNNTYNEWPALQSYIPQIPLLFYSHTVLTSELKAHFFWTLSVWNDDGLNFERGIDRFLYNGEIGIIGGDYTFYFKKIKSNSQSADCAKQDWYAYLNNELKLMPVKVIRNIEKHIEEN